jgi:hypothetical protein
MLAGNLSTLYNKHEQDLLLNNQGISSERSKPIKTSLIDIILGRTKFTLERKLFFGGIILFIPVAQCPFPLYLFHLNLDLIYKYFLRPNASLATRSSLSHL